MIIRFIDADASLKKRQNILWIYNLVSPRVFVFIEFSYLSICLLDFDTVDEMLKKKSKESKDSSKTATKDATKELSNKQQEGRLKCIVK